MTDHDTALRTAREAAARAFEESGYWEMANDIRKQTIDNIAIKSAYFAARLGADLLKPAEPVEQPEVVAAIRYADQHDDKGADAFLAGVEWARQQEAGNAD